MTFPIRKSACKLTEIVKITIVEVFPEMKPLGNAIIFTLLPTSHMCVPGLCAHIPGTHMWLQETHANM